MLVLVLEVAVVVGAPLRLARCAVGMLPPLVAVGVALPMLVLPMAVIPMGVIVGVLAMGVIPMGVVVVPCAVLAGLAVGMGMGVALQMHRGPEGEG